MATATAVDSKTKKEELAVQKLDRLFRIDPINRQSKDEAGRRILLEHRVGPATIFTKGDLLKRTGLEKEYFDTCLRLERKFRDRDAFDKLCEQVFRGTKAKLNGWLRSYRGWMRRYYAGQNIQPLMVFVPKVGHDDHVVYIQAFVDLKTSKLVAGELSDLALWAETTAVWTQNAAERYADAVQVAKNILRLPGVNPDMKSRMNLLVNGECSRKLLLEHREDKK